MLALSVAVGAASPAAAQSVLNQFSYDNLRPSAIQVDLGALNASKLESALIAGVRLDYGLIAPKVRVLLGLSYFRAPFDQETLTEFEQRIRDIVVDPSGDDTVDVGEVSWSHIVFDMDFQYVIPQGKVFTTYIGLGIGVQLRNGSGTSIDGTFIDDALDQLAAAGNISIGLEARVANGLYLTGDARGMLSVGLATVSARAGFMYRWAGGSASRP